MDAIKINSRNTVKEVPAHYLPTGTYCAKWPFMPGMRLYTKGLGGRDIELTLKHETKCIEYTHDGITCSSNDGPTKVFRFMSYYANVMSKGASSSNWSYLWIRMGDDPMFVKGIDLRRAYAVAHDKEPIDVVRTEIPTA
jgi:hypothetical protein